MNARRAVYTGAIFLMSASLVAVTRPVEPARHAPLVASIQELGWLAGHWEGVEGTTQMEEVWLEPRAGVMIGMHRDVFSNGRYFFENLLIEDTGDGVVYYASPGGRQPPTPFHLTERGPSKAVFSNPGHDFPQTLTYELTDDGDLHVSAAGNEGGQRVFQSWTWAKKVAK